jgi:hypothetical protein
LLDPSKRAEVESVSEAIEASREALHYLLVELGGNSQIKPMRRTFEAPDGTRHEERYPVQRAETMIFVPESDIPPGFLFLSPCSCPGSAVRMRRYAHTIQNIKRLRDAEGRIIDLEISVWAGQCPECGTIHWREYVPLETSVAG